MSGLLGHGAAYEATHECDLLILLGTDFPYGAFLPADVWTLRRFRDRAALRVSLSRLREGLRGGHGTRAPMSWRTVVQLTRCGRPPVV